MAIKEKSGMYLKVSPERMNFPNIIGVEVFRNEEHRLTGGDAFDQKLVQNVHCPSEFVEKMSVKADSKKTVLENMISAAYEAIKTLPPYNSWENC